MSIQVDLWHLLTALSGFLLFFLGIVGFLGRLLVKQFKEHVDSKFSSMETARVAASEHWDKKFAELDAATRNLKTDFLEWKADLPEKFQRREDAIRQEVGIIARLDGLSLQIDKIREKT